MQETWRTKEQDERARELIETDLTEARALIRQLALGPEDVFVDFGCGLGDMVFLAARRARKSVGVEPSSEKAASARRRFQGIPNVEVVQADLLDFRHEGDRFTRGFAKGSLRRLDDALKCEFFGGVSALFEPGALFLIEDMILDFDRSELDERADELSEEASRFYGLGWEARKPGLLQSLKHEFPTGFNAWSAALDEGGFRVQDRWQKCSFYGGILAKKK